jgi:two-component system chemotaxis sensor kinase CheA
VVPILNVADLIQSATKKAPGPTLAADSPKAPAAPAARSILVAEDSITARTLLKNILELAGYQVQTAVDGLEAFTLLQRRPFDLVVSDVEMPRMNGFELTARIRADKQLAELPVILVTALESPEDKKRGIEVGANAYLVKSSFDQGNLLTIIQQLI